MIQKKHRAKTGHAASLNSSLFSKAFVTSPIIPTPVFRFEETPKKCSVVSSNIHAHEIPDSPSPDLLAAVVENSAVVVDSAEKVIHHAREV
jgi:hypothetical protein